MTTPRKTPTARQNLDEEGFLLEPETWTREIAQNLSRGEVSGELTEDHWKIVDCVRQYYLDFETVPPVRLVVRRTGFSLRRLHELFPHGFAKGACRVAGIPRETLRVTRTLSVYHT